MLHATRYLRFMMWNQLEPYSLLVTWYSLLVFRYSSLATVEPTLTLLATRDLVLIICYSPLVTCYSSLATRDLLLAFLTRHSLLNE